MKKDPLSTCPSDKKTIMKKRKHYYRDGRYYCSKGCWKAVNRPQVEQQEGEEENV